MISSVFVQCVYIRKDVSISNSMYLTSGISIKVYFAKAQFKIAKIQKVR